MYHVFVSIHECMYFTSHCFILFYCQHFLSCQFTYSISVPPQQRLCTLSPLLTPRETTPSLPSQTRTKTLAFQPTRTHRQKTGTRQQSEIPAIFLTPPWRTTNHSTTTKVPFPNGRPSSRRREMKEKKKKKGTLVGRAPSDGVVVHCRKLAFCRTVLRFPVTKRANYLGRC